MFHAPLNQVILFSSDLLTQGLDTVAIADGVCTSVSSATDTLTPPLTPLIPASRG